MELDENIGSIISEEKARQLINSFKLKYVNEITSSFIGASNVRNILEQENCIGIRIHNGYDDENRKMSLVFVGVDNNGNEMLDGGQIYDRLKICPDYCPIDGLGF